MHSSNDNDLEDGEIPSDEDDEAIVPAANVASEAAKPTPKSDSSTNKNFDAKFNKNKKQQPTQAAGKHFLKYKNPTEDWAGDVEKAIKAAMEEDGGGKNQESKSKNKNNRNKVRKRVRDEKEEDRSKEQKVCITHEITNFIYNALKFFFWFTKTAFKAIGSMLSLFYY